MRSFSKMTAAVALAASMLLATPTAFAAEQGVIPGASAARDSFYNVPQGLPQEPGQVVKSLPDSVRYSPVNLVGGPATGTRLMYTTENSVGETVAATAVALRSNVEWKGQGERPLVVLAPGTQGLGDQCAPSSKLVSGSGYALAELTALLNKGYNVTVIDYIGGGTEGTLSYLNRLDQGHAVLDAARASTSGSVNFVSAGAPCWCLGLFSGWWGGCLCR